MTSSGGENSSLKIVALIAGLIVSCIAIFTFITGYQTLRDIFDKESTSSESFNSSNQNNEPKATQQISQSVLATPTEYGIYNPSGVISSGVPVITDNYYMVIDPSGMTVDGKFIGFEIQIKAIGDQNRLFRYNASSLSLTDDLGNNYNYYINIGSGRCTESDIYLSKQIMLEPNKKIIIEPHTDMMYASYFWWCLENHDQDIPGFTGEIPLSAKSLYLNFDNFGPFTGFSIEFKL